MQNRLNDSAGIVVGSNSFVGFAMLNELAERGVKRLTGTFLERDKNSGVGIDEVSRLIGAKADFTALELDQTDDDQVRAVIAEAQERMGGLDLLVTAAARQSEKPHLGQSAAEIQAQIMVNLFGTMNVIAHGARSMILQAQGEAPNPRHRAMGSVLSIRGMDPIMCHAYDAAKAGMAQHVAALSKEVGPHGISFNGVAPGTINSPLEWERHGCSQADYEERWRLLTPFGGKPVTPEHVAEELVNLMNSGSVTGQIVNVDGGFGRMRPLPTRATQ